jgi:hypothetical protein
VDHDLGGTWAPDGTIWANGQDLEASLWRYRVAPRPNP